MKPKYLICDKGKRFWCESFEGWCERKDIEPRFGAVGKKGSIALIERFIGSLKRECMDVIMVPFREGGFRRDLALFADWYNEHRPHSGLDGLTPAEVYRGDRPACQRSLYEPRVKWPREAVCSSPKAPVAGNPGGVIRLDVRYHAGRRHMPIVSLKRAA